MDFARSFDFSYFVACLKGKDGPLASFIPLKKDSWLDRLESMGVCILECLYLVGGCGFKGRNDTAYWRTRNESLSAFLRRYPATFIHLLGVAWTGWCKFRSLHNLHYSYGNLCFKLSISLCFGCIQLMSFMYTIS